MTDEPTKSADQRNQEPRTQTGGSSKTGSSSKSPGSSPTLGDPKRLEYGDKTDDESEKMDKSESDEMSTKGHSSRFGGQNDQDAGEGHKGPRTSGSTDSRTQGDRSGSANQPKQQSGRAPQDGVDSKSGSDRNIRGTQSNDKSTRTQSGGGSSE